MRRSRTLTPAWRIHTVKVRSPARWFSVSTGTHGHKVLLVEDTTTPARRSQPSCGAPGATWHDAWGGEDGLRQLREGFRPCVALIDVRMPGMDGWTMSDHMRGDPDATIASTSVVLVSGDPAAQARARAAGIREFLPKPLDGAALIGAVERYCGRHAV